MDDNPYASPETPGGFYEDLDRPATVKSVLDERLLRKETRRVVELTGVGGYLGILVFVGLIVVALFWSEPPGARPREPLLVLAAVAAAVATHLGTIHFLATRRLRKMRTLYDVQPGDAFEIEIRPGVVHFRSDRADCEWELHEVAGIGGNKMLTFVVNDVLTLPLPAAADFGDLDLAGFTALYKEQQRRYRETRPFFERLRYAFRGAGWV